MRKLKAAARIGMAAALVATGAVVVSASPAMAAGCNGNYVGSPPNGYRAGACFGYPYYFKVRASVSCSGTTRYGNWVAVASYSTKTCYLGESPSNGSFQVSP